jgi:hypothetical protein
MRDLPPNGTGDKGQVRFDHWGSHKSNVTNIMKSVAQVGFAHSEADPVIAAFSEMR